ncbi:MAG: restriction endonuclease subunit S, partial [Sulfuricurvum sp.]
MEVIIDYRGKTPTKTTHGIPLVTAKIIKAGRMEEPNEFIAIDAFASWMTRGLPLPGDVVLTTEAPLGEVAQLDERKVALAQRVITLRGKSGLLDNTYLKYVLQGNYVRSQLLGRASGSTVSGIKQSELRKVKIPIPPFAQQQNIARILGSLDDKITLNREINKTLEAMAQAIFKSWFVDFEPFKEGGFVESELGMIPKGWEVKPLTECTKVLGGGTPKTSIPEYWNGDIPWFSVVDAPSGSDVFVVETEKNITQEGLKNSSTKLLDAGTTIVTARG